MNPGEGGGDSQMKQTGMLVGNFEFNPLEETIWAWLKLFVIPIKETNLGVAYANFDP